MESIHDQILQLTPKEIKEKDPIELLRILQDTFTYFKDQMNEMRREPLLDTKGWQDIQITWGKWSHSFNGPLRLRIKECDMFPDDDFQRFQAKRLNLIHLYWTKCFIYIEAIAQNNPIKNAVIIHNALEQMEEARDAFINAKEEALPKWVKSSQLENQNGQE